LLAIAPKDLALLVGITLIWGANLIVSRWGVGEIPPLLFTALRFLLLGVVLLPWLRLQRGRMSAVIVAAVLAGGLHFAMMFIGIALASNVSAIAIAGQLGVPFTTLLSVALLGETVRWRRWTGIALAFLGVMIIGFDPAVLDGGVSLLWVVGSAFVGSLGLIAVKRLGPIEPLQMQAWIAWTSVPLILALSLLIERPDLSGLSEVSARAWAAVAYTALAASLIAHTGFYYLVQRYPVSSVAPLTVLSPLFSIVFAVTLLDDTLTGRILLGGAVTLAGVVIITVRERRIVDTGS
jgi:O-acetylserine/cysteine efflux transporter